MTDSDSPAGRLFELLTAMKNQPAAKTIEDAWAAVFELRAGQRSLTLRGISDVLDLPNEIEREIKNLEGVEDTELLLLHMPDIKAALAESVNLTTGVQHLGGRITGEMLLSLRHSATASYEGAFPNPGSTDSRSTHGCKRSRRSTTRSIWRRRSRRKNADSFSA